MDDYKNNGVKSLDSEVEKLVRDLLEAWYSPATPLEHAKQMEKVINPLRWHIQKKDSCEFVEDWGAECASKAVRVSYSIPCCKRHANIRDRSFR